MGGDDVQPSKYVSGLIVTATAAAASSKVNSRANRVRAVYFLVKLISVQSYSIDETAGFCVGRTKPQGDDTVSARRDGNLVRISRQQVGKRKHGATILVTFVTLPLLRFQFANVTFW